MRDFIDTFGTLESHLAAKKGRGAAEDEAEDEGTDEDLGGASAAKAKGGRGSKRASKEMLQRLARAEQGRLKPEATLRLFEAGGRAALEVSAPEFPAAQFCSGAAHRGQRPRPAGAGRSLHALV